MQTYTSWAGLLVFVILPILFRSGEIARYWIGYVIILVFGVVIIGYNINRIQKGQV